MCQPLLDAVAAHLKSPMLNHTLQRTFGPAVRALHGPALRYILTTSFHLPLTLGLSMRLDCSEVGSLIFQLQKSHKVKQWVIKGGWWRDSQNGLVQFWKRQTIDRHFMSMYKNWLWLFVHSSTTGRTRDWSIMVGILGNRGMGINLDGSEVSMRLGCTMACH